MSLVFVFSYFFGYLCQDSQTTRACVCLHVCERDFLCLRAHVCVFVCICGRGRVCMSALARGCVYLCEHACVCVRERECLCGCL